MKLNVIMPIPMVMPIHGGGNIPPSVLGYIILITVAYTAYAGYCVDKNVEEDRSGWKYAFLLAWPWIVLALFLIIH